MSSIRVNPSAGRQKLLLVQINRYDVCSHRADAAIWSIGDRGCQARLIFIKPFESLNQFFPAHVLAYSLQSLNQYFGSAIRGNLRRQMMGRKFVLVRQRAKLFHALGALIGRASREREEQLSIESDRSAKNLLAAAGTGEKDRGVPL